MCVSAQKAAKGELSPIKNGNGNDDAYMDYDFRILQRAVILTLIIIGVIPLNKNSEPKDIKADNDYAYGFFEKYILGKLPESNMNVGSFGALEAWKNVSIELPEDFDEDDYQDALHAQRVIKRRLKDMGEKQIVEWDAAANQAKANDKDPDFLTVNEFLWFVKEHENLIKEKVMANTYRKTEIKKVGQQPINDFSDFINIGIT